MCEKLGQPMFEVVSNPDEVRTRTPLTMPKKTEEKDRAPTTIPATPDRVPLTTVPATAPSTAKNGSS